MAEIDPVILQLRAEVDRYQADVRRATRTVEQQIGQQERRVKALENQFRSSSSAIGASLKSLAGTLATAFTGRELIGLIDQFTRFQNSLRVAGLEGEALAAVQERLFATGARYGVSVNALADLYGKAEQAGRDLGASQAQLLTLTDAVAQSLLVSGVSTEQASGAILGLSQALASGTVRAEEFNQINEGGLRVLLEAAAAGDRFGGSVSKLRAAVLDGKVSSEEFFRSILANTDLIEGRAANANLTLAGAIQSLNDALARYVGEAANANGITGALAQGIQALANNLDTIIPAIATIATLFGVRFVAGLAASAVQAAGLRVIALGLAVQLNGTAAAATLAGRSLLAAFGGPVGLAIGAIAVGLTLVATSARGAEAATGEYKRALEESRKATDSAREAAERLASAHGKTRDEALRAANAERELTKQKLAGARASLVQAQAELKKAQAFQAGQNRASFGATGVPGTGAFIQGRGDTRVATARSNVDAANERIKNLEGAIATLDAAIAGTSVPGVIAGGSAASSGRASGGGGRSGPDPADIELRYRSELDSIRIRINQAEGERARTAEERAEFEGRQLEFAQDQALRELEADKDYSEAQKAEIRARLLALGEAERDNIEFRKRAQLEREAIDILEERGQAEIDALRLQFDLADTEAERRRIALQILDAENDLLRSKFEAIIASDTAAEADRERARIDLEALDAQAGAQRASTERQFEGPLARYGRNAKDVDTRVQEAAVRRIEELNETISDAMTRALGVKDPFLSQLIKIFLDRNVFGPLAEALSQRSGGGRGFLGGLVSTVGQILPGILGGSGGVTGGKAGGIMSVGRLARASGGPVTAGQMYRVNEGAAPGRVEGFVPNVSGQIIPLGRMNAAQPAAPAQGGVSVVRLELSGDIDARIQRVSGPVAVEVVRATAPQVIDAAANETLRRASRPTL